MRETKPDNYFNKSPSNIMHIDLNSCFASIEQQANPKLRGVPTVVAAYPTGGGCVLAASREAKKLGIKTGWRVRDAQKICHQVAILTPDPAKYRHVHKEMMKIFESYCGDVTPKSIDEAVLDFGNDANHSPNRHSEVSVPKNLYCIDPSLRIAQDDGSSNLFFVGQKIKKDIKEKIGEWLTVSVGIGPNRFLAKTAAGLKKPDGLEEINHTNIVKIFKNLKVEDLCGINVALKSRLNASGIYSALEFLETDLPILKSIFKSICSYHWYMRLRGFEVDNWSTERKSIGHSYALPKATGDERELGKILFRLCEKVGLRLRNNNLEAQGVYLSGSYKDRTYFRKSHKLHRKIFTTPEIYQHGLRILDESLKRVRPCKGSNPIGTLAVGVFELSKSLYQQQTLFEDQNKKRHLAQALDEINNKYGNFSVTFGTTADLSKKILDRISFGGIRDI